MRQHTHTYGQRLVYFLLSKCFPKNVFKDACMCNRNDQKILQDKH